MFILLCSPLSIAETHAILIGVSQYPKLNQSRWLSAPKNDVALMRDSLKKLGMPSSNIKIIADGITQPATREFILSSLKQQIETLKKNDWLIFYASGHGSRQPQLTVNNGYVETDGMNEIFLPYDTSSWNARLNTVENAIIDDEFYVLFEKAKNKGVGIWAIFDTCHAGNMAKSLSFSTKQQKYRYVSPTELGIPPDLLNHSSNLKKKQRTLTAKGITQNTSQIFFYASQQDEQAPEELLPNLEKNRQNEKLPQGLFTWHLQKALLNFNGTLASLALKIKEQYKKENRPFPTPVFEGSLEQLISLEK